MLSPLRNSRYVPRLEQHLRLHTRRYSAQCPKNRDGGSNVFHTYVFEPGGRSAKMPAVFSFQESFGLLQNEKSMNTERYLIIEGRCQWWSRCKCNA